MEKSVISHKDAEFQIITSLLESASYIFAKTMPDEPHWYTLRKTWDDDAFVEVVEYIRSHGYERNYKGRRYTSLDVGDYYYWTMGEPINKDGKPHTILINRAEIREKSLFF